MSKYSIGSRVTVFYNGERTIFEYAGQSEWRFISGCDSPARYAQLLDMIK